MMMLGVEMVFYVGVAAGSKRERERGRVRNEKWRGCIEYRQKRRERKRK